MKSTGPPEHPAAPLFLSKNHARGQRPKYRPLYYDTYDTVDLLPPAGRHKPSLHNLDADTSSGMRQPVFKSLRDEKKLKDTCI